MRLEVLLNTFLAAKAIRSAYMFRPIRTCLWGFAALFISKQLSRGMMAASSVIKKIDLHQDGITVDIYFQDNSVLQIPVNEFQRISEGAHASEDSISRVNIKERVAAFQEHQKRFGPHADRYSPLIINSQLFVLDQSCIVPHREILDSVTKGIPIWTNFLEERERLCGDFLDPQLVIKKPTWVDITNIQ